MEDFGFEDDEENINKKLRFYEEKTLKHKKLFKLFSFGLICSGIFIFNTSNFIIPLCLSFSFSTLIFFNNIEINKIEEKIKTLNKKKEQLFTTEELTKRINKRLEKIEKQREEKLNREYTNLYNGVRHYTIGDPDFNTLKEAKVYKKVLKKHP